MNRALWMTVLVLATSAGCGDRARELDPNDDGAAPIDDGGSLSSDADTGTESGACDPFAPRPKPIELGTLIAAGADSTGTIYVVSDPFMFTDAHVFVSEGSVLVRKHVAGAGGGAGALEFVVHDHDPPFRLIVYMRPPDAVTGIELAHDDARGAPVVAERLTLVTSEQLEPYELRNFPGHVRTEHSGQLDDGRIMVVTAPVDDLVFEDFRLYFGPRDQVTERLVYSASRGSTTFIEFDLDGQRVEVEFGSVLTGTSGGVLTIGSQTLRLAPLAPSTEETIFVCAP